jgi:hypothetical protein
MILCWGGQGHPPTDAATLDAIAIIVRARTDGRVERRLQEPPLDRTRRESKRHAPCASDGAITTALNTPVMIARCFVG